MQFGLFIPQGWRHDLVGIDPAQHWGVRPRAWPVAPTATRTGPRSGCTTTCTDPAPAEEATHEAWSLMAAFAGVTGRIRLGQMCTCMGYRNPAHLAKVAATVDVISEGRLDMGIGAGWYEHEWRAYGYGFPSARAGSGSRPCARAWRSCASCGPPGRARTLRGAVRRRRRPVLPPAAAGRGVPGSRRNGIPLWVAGGGERKTLRIAAEYGLHELLPDPEEFTAKSEILRGHCADVGRDFDEIVRSAD